MCISYQRLAAELRDNIHESSAGRPPNKVDNNRATTLLDAVNLCMTSWYNEYFSLHRTQFTIMDTRPAKRQRRFTVHSSNSDDDDFDAQVDIDDSDSGDDQTSSTDTRTKYGVPQLSDGHSSRLNTKRLSVLSSRPKSTTTTTTTSAAASSRPTPSPEKRKQTKGLANAKSEGGSLHGFFQPASEEQRWSSRKFEPTHAADTGGEKAGDDDDLIEDDDSFDELFTRHFIEGQGESDANGRKSQGDIAPPVKSKPARKHTSTKRFLMPGSPEGGNRSKNSPVTAAAGSGDDDKRPWAQKYGPLDLSELAVHKKKVSDVQNWLLEVFAGKSARVCLYYFSP